MRNIMQIQQRNKKKNKKQMHFTHNLEYYTRLIWKEKLVIIIHTEQCNKCNSADPNITKQNSYSDEARDPIIPMKICNIALINKTEYLNSLKVALKSINAFHENDKTNKLSKNTDISSMLKISKIYSYNPTNIGLKYSKHQNIFPSITKYKTNEDINTCVNAINMTTNNGVQILKATVIFFIFTGSVNPNLHDPMHDDHVSPDKILASP